MSTLNLLFLFVGAALVYSAALCVQVLPLLRGEVAPGRRCTGSMLSVLALLVGATIAKAGFKDFKLPPLGAIFRRRGGKGGGKGAPPEKAPGGKGAPPEEAPPPGAAPPEEIGRG